MTEPSEIELVAVQIPRTLVDRIAAQWPRLAQDPSVRDLAPRHTDTGAVRAGLVLICEQLERPAP